MRSPSSTHLTPIRRRCRHTLLSTMFKASGFVLVGDKNNNNKFGPGTGKAGDITRDSRDTTNLFQQLSVACNRGTNAVSFQNTFTAG